MQPDAVAGPDVISPCPRPPVHPRSGASLRSAAAPAARPKAGPVLAGRYRLTEMIGNGATASVWRAHDELLDRDVALKRFLGRHTDGVGEARIAARVRHANVAAVHDVCSTAARLGW